MISSDNDFINSLSQKNTHHFFPIYMLYGTEKLQLEDALFALEKHIIKPESRDLNYNLFYMPETSFETILNSANSMPFLSNNRLIVVKNFNKFPASCDEKMEKYIENPCHTTCMVLVCDEKLPSRNIFKIIIGHKNAICVEFKKVYENKMPSWVINYAKKYFKTMSYEAAERLVEIAGENLQEIKNEIDKLLLYAAYKKQITEKDVEECSSYIKKETIFELMDNLAEKDEKKCFKTVAKMYNSGTEEIEIISGVANGYRKYLAFMEMKDKGIFEKTALTRIGVHSFFQNKFIGQVAKYTKNEILHGLELILQTDLKLKSGWNKKMLVEKLLLDLCKPLT